MARFSVSQTADGTPRVKLHHDYGPFEFYFYAGDANGETIAWMTEPELPRADITDRIARTALGSLCKFLSKSERDIKFKDVLNGLQKAERLA